jgi:hypothetical protein
LAIFLKAFLNNMCISKAFGVILIQSGKTTEKCCGRTSARINFDNICEIIQTSNGIFKAIRDKSGRISSMQTKPGFLPEGRTGKIPAPKGHPIWSKIFFLVETLQTTQTSRLFQDFQDHKLIEFQAQGWRYRLANG